MKKQEKKLWKGFNDTHKCRCNECPDELTLSAYIDGKLSDKEVDSVEFHLSECDSCLDIVSQIRQLDSSSNADHSKLNKKVLNAIFFTRHPASAGPEGRPALPYNAFRHVKVAALAACFIIIFSVVMVMVSKNKNQPVSTDAKIARIIELYNNNKFYKLSAESKDGYEPSDTFCSSTRIMHHAADTDKNGRISMNEVLQYISANNPKPANRVAGN